MCPLFLPDYWTVHDITFIRYPESFDWKFRIIYRMFYRIALPRCNGVFTVSEFSRDEICKEFGVKSSIFTIVYNSGNYFLENKYQNIDLTGFGLEGENYYLSVSSRNKHKNQGFITQLAIQTPDKRFVIVGGLHKSFNKIEKKKIENVLYAGYVSDNELFSLYRNASGFIFPSLYEGFGIPPLEAVVLNCRRIALADIPVFRELYEKVYFFDPCRAEEFSFDKSLKTQITSELRQHYIEKYSYQNGGKKYYQSFFDTELGRNGV